MSVLVITEKYKQAQSFAKVLSADNKQTTFKNGSVGFFTRESNQNLQDVGKISGNDKVVVTWAAGHLLQSAMPDQVDENMKRWSMDNLPWFPEKWKFLPQTHDPAKSQWKVVKDLLDSDEFDTIYIATDSDREGCLIYHLMYINSKARLRKNLNQYRCWYIEFTEAAVKKAIEEAKPQTEYDFLVDASVARMKFDYLYGCNMSRAYTIYHHNTRNVGRVVSSVLYLIVKRQEEIDNFVPQDYIVIKLPLKDGEKQFTAEKKMTDIEAGKKLAESLKGQTATIKNIEQKQEKEQRRLFNTTKLMSAATKNGLSVKQVEQALQDLWDMGAISYPRTKSETLLEAQLEDLKNLPEKIYEKVFASPSQCSTNDFDMSRAVGKGGKSAEEASHTGLYPTEQGCNLYMSKIKTEPNLRLVFLLISSRFISAILPPRETLKTTVTVLANNEDFTATGTVEVKSGFYAFEKYVNSAIKQKKERQKSTQVLPDMNIGDVYNCLSPKTQTKQTSPPKPYDVPSLLNAMESASQFVDDKKLKEMLKDVGIGTASSRGSIIDTIKKGQYVEITGGRMVPTQKATTLMSDIPEKLKTPVMTAQMELKLDEISRGDLDKDTFLKDCESLITEEINNVKKLPPIPDTERYKDNKIFVKNACPICGANIVETEKSVVCQHNCGFIVWRTIAKKKIPKTELDNIIRTGHSTAKLSGFKSKAGKDFDTWLYVDRDGKTQFDFSDNGSDALNNNIIQLNENASLPASENDNNT